MLQGQRYWPGFCAAAGRPDLISDLRFATAEDRQRNIGACVAELDSLFARHTLAEWQEMLSGQDGPWDLVQHVGEIKDDLQVKANGYMQQVDYGDGRKLSMISVPIQFDGEPLPARPAPQLGADSDAVLAEFGYDQDAIIDLKFAGVVL